MTAVDTNVLADVQVSDPVHFDQSVAALELAASEGAVIIGEVVYAELAAHLSLSDLDAFLADFGISLIPSSPAALYRAGQAFGAYLRTRGQQIQCSACGHAFRAECPACGSTVAWRQHLLPDFLIGAHAELHADRLLTRDRGIYARFFPKLTLGI